MSDYANFTPAERRRSARQVAVPAIPFDGQPEMAFMRGKACDADWFAHGEPLPRVNEKGATYGWDVMTGRVVVPLMCSYCDYRAKHCWQEAVMELDGAKPIWVLPSRPAPIKQEDESGVTPPGRTVATATVTVQQASDAADMDYNSERKDR